MKAFNFIKRVVSVIVILSMIAISLVSCGGTGKPLLKLEKQSISVNVFELYLSRMKGMLCSADYFGEAAKKTAFWETLKDVSTKQTYSDYYTEMVLDTAKTHLAALAEFEKRGLTLPQSYIDEIDAELDALIQNEADGSKSAFNAILADYGANYDILRESYIIEAKIAYLREVLFGKNGSKVSAEMIDDYYNENYARFKQVFLYTYEFLYEEDENGDEIYYRDDNSRISYDTTKTAKVKDDGSYVTDENGDRIYVYIDADGKERIAYKKEGARTKQIYDSNGDPKVRYYKDSDPEMKIVNSDANEILAEAKTGDYAGFNILVAEYNQDEGVKDYPNGYYVSKNTQYEAVDVIKQVLEMEVGEVRKIQSDYGIHIVMRYELQDEAYTFEENEDLFISTETGTYIFMGDLMDQLFLEYMEEYKADIVVDEKLLETVDIESTGINFYY